MGYLNEFRDRFAKRLEGLDPEQMKQALNEACDALLESYHNGQKSCAKKSAAGGKEGATRPARTRYQKRA
jgi:hypothetical protein